jgi:hypothetical protein
VPRAVLVHGAGSTEDMASPVAPSLGDIGGDGRGTQLVRGPFAVKRTPGPSELGFPGLRVRLLAVSGVLGFYSPCGCRGAGRTCHNLELD